MHFIRMHVYIHGICASTLIRWCATEKEEMDSRHPCVYWEPWWRLHIRKSGVKKFSGKNSWTENVHQLGFADQIWVTVEPANCGEQLVWMLVVLELPKIKTCHLTLPSVICMWHLQIDELWRDTVGKRS